MELHFIYKNREKVSAICSETFLLLYTSYTQVIYSFPQITISMISGSLAKNGSSSTTQRALEKFSSASNALASKSALIRTILPRLTALNNIRLPFQTTPPNIIRVSLDEEFKKAHPGDEIQGSIKLMISEPVTVQKLEVQLFGQSETYAARPSAIGNHIEFKSLFQLADESVEIELKQKFLTPKIYNFRFQIMVPRTVAVTQGDWPFDERTRRFNSDFTQALPGSFAAFSTEHARAECSIKYFVIAKLVSEAEQEDKIHHRVPLHIVVDDSRALMAGEMLNKCFMSCIFKFRSSSVAIAGTSTPSPPLSPVQDISKQLDSPSVSPGFRGRLKDSLKDNILRFKLPMYFFRLDATIPRSGRLSEPLNIILKLVWGPPKSKRVIEGSPPPILLQALRVELQSRCISRGVTEDDINSSSYAAVEKTATFHCIWRSKRITISELKNPMPDLGPETDVGRLMYVYPHSFLPAFKTYNIAREYVLTVWCDLECAGELFQAKFEVENFDILAEGGVDDDFFEARASMKARVESEDEEDAASCSSLPENVPKA